MSYKHNEKKLTKVRILFKSRKKICKKDFLKISELQKLDIYSRDKIIENFLRDRNLFTTNKLKNIINVLNKKGTLTQNLGENKLLVKRYDLITIESLKYSKSEETSLELDKLIIFKNYTII